MTMAQQVDFNIKIYTVETDSTIQILADNQESFPMSVSLNFKIKGANLEGPLDKYYVLDPSSKENYLTSIIKPVNRKWSYQYGYVYSMGNALAVHNDNYIYQLPFPKGKSYSLTQGYNGRTTHRGINALDFTMPEGDTIVATRGGLVIRIKEDSNRGCPSANCSDDANYVSILHDDGTIADYAHLKENGALVNIGDQVERGQVIGLNGDTGWASGAHLHFIVYTTGQQAQISIPVEFETQPGNQESLKEGNSYTAF